MQGNLIPGTKLPIVIKIPNVMHLFSMNKNTNFT